MIKIDGSYGEGGGQIVRTAVALSAATGKNIKIHSIRKNRPNPGLKHQHVKTLETATRVCNAEVTGVSLNSSSVEFFPGDIKGSCFRVDIGTAGSITLLLQCIMPLVTQTAEDIQLEITGGTDVAWSPTIDYLKYVTVPALSKMRFSCDINTIRRGYYPVGMGVVHANLKPSKLHKFDFTSYRPSISKISGMSHCSNLPEHIAQRQKKSASQHLNTRNFDSDILTEVLNNPSTGTGITLWRGFFGSSELGKRGLPAEKIGKKAAENLTMELESEATVDIHLADQLIPYMGLFPGCSYTVRELTKHTKTNIWVTEQFLDVNFKIIKENNLFWVSSC
ncbi:MAG: RNA 3'-terminal phosphate cyclase [Methanohalobium sp.]|uniref:RNA 3'-terminal phosphate cyclase n=1 Tax=Methanohalobium sp. TaxID=2837493 RepID=UPI00397824D2